LFVLAQLEASSCKWISVKQKCTLLIVLHLLLFCSLL